MLNVLQRVCVYQYMYAWEFMNSEIKIHRKHLSMNVEEAYIMLRFRGWVGCLLDVLGWLFVII